MQLFTMKHKAFAGTSKPFLLPLLLIMAGCDKHVATVIAEPVQPPPIQFPDLSRLKGKAASGLTKDAAIAAHIYDVVPVVRYNCMDDIFRYMHDLEVTADGTLLSDAAGSHAESFRTGFFSLTPAGDLDIVLQCENGKTDHRLFQYFTTRPAATSAPSSVMTWLRMQAIPGDELRRMDVSGVNDFEYTAIEKTALTAVSRPSAPSAQSIPPAQPRPAPVEEHYVVAGGVICVNPYDFYRVNALEMAHNPYAQLPAGCETVGANLPVNFIHSDNGYLQIGNEGGTAWVRPRDFR